MSNNSDWLDGEEIIKIRANYDKSTKTTWRYIVESNDYEISGALYVKKVPDVKDKDAPSSLVIKLKAKS